MRILILASLVAVSAAACAKQTVFLPSEGFLLVVTDNRGEFQFDLELQSRDDRPICITVEQWPNEDGQLHMGSEMAVLRTKDNLIRAKDVNFGSCPGGCGEIRISPGSSLEGRISYAAFGDPAAVASSSVRDLEFGVFPYYCSR